MEKKKTKTFSKTSKQVEATKLMASHRETLLEGGSRCFIGSQKVITSNGSKPIEELQEGDLVLSVNSKGKEEFKPILKKHLFPDNKKPMIKLKLKNGKTIEGTYDHRVYFMGGWHSLKSIVEYIYGNMETNTKF